MNYINLKIYSNNDILLNADHCILNYLQMYITVGSVNVTIRTILLYYSNAYDLVVVILNTNVHERSIDQSHPLLFEMIEYCPLTNLICRKINDWIHARAFSCRRGN